MATKTASMMAVTLTVVVLVAVCCRCAFAVGEDAESAFAEDLSMGPDELTARPPWSSDVPATDPMVAGRQPSNKPAATNIQKVVRTPKAVNAMSAMMMMMAAVSKNDTASADDSTWVPDNTQPSSSSSSPLSSSTGTTSSTYLSDLEWLLNVYNPHQWNPSMLPAASKLSVQCRDTMKVYLEALRQGSFWAAKSKCRL